MKRTVIIPLGFLLLLVFCLALLPENNQSAILTSLETKLYQLSVWQILALIGLATLLSEDLTCIGSGILAATTELGLIHAILGCYFGILVGDFLLYLSGRCLGKPFLRKKPLSWVLDPAMVGRSEQWFTRRGGMVVFLTRFLPGSRTATYFVAGALSMPMGRFVLYFSTAALAWAPLVVCLAYIFGREVLNYYQQYAFLALPLVLAGLVFVHSCSAASAKVFSYRQQRLILSKWRRISSWEFWPAWMIYPPILVYGIAQALCRYRNLMAFTCVNPAIPPDSGILGESKSNTLSLWPADHPAVARWTCLDHPLDHKAYVCRLTTFLSVNQLDFPLIFKPDEGQRGLGVRRIGSLQEGWQYVRGAAGRIIVQEYVGGLEFGLFYLHLPGERQGRLTSMTEKKLITVTGNGYDTLETLILKDDRAVCMAPTFLDRFRDELDLVLPAGRVKQLVRIGTHSQGALFLDASVHMTPALNDWIQTTMEQVHGIHYGRFDVRVSSLSDLQKGRGIKVLEFNGLAAEPTDMYDPRYSIVHTWKTLASHWAHIVHIGYCNAKSGVKPMGLVAFFRHLRQASLRQRGSRYYG